MNGNVNIRDKPKPITAEDLIRRYKLDSLEKDRKALRVLNDGLTKTDKIIENFMINVINNIENQADGFVTAWFFDGIPTLENDPFIEFDTEELENKLNDFYYDRTTGYIYKLDKKDDIYCWSQLDDISLKESLAIAGASADTYDHKRNIYLEIPTTPYDVGDIWYNGKDIYRCRCSRSDGDYHDTDWCLQKDYSDEFVFSETRAVLDSFKEEVYEEYATKSQLETTANSIDAKVEGVTTEVRNNYLETNEKFNDYATVETVTQQINSVEEKITSNEAKITIINETLENGITKVKTEKGYTFDNEGLSIDDSNSKVKNTLNENGMDIIDKTNNESLLFAGYDKELQETVVKSKNMTVQKYFSIPHARYEKYMNPNHGEGTGCFYV